MPPAGTTRIVLLRKDADTFTGWNDPAAYVVMDGMEKSLVDTAGLYNGVTFYYRAYYWNGSVWLASGTKPATPAATFVDQSVDVVSVVRDRVDLGMQVYIQRGLLSHPMNHIPVMTASPLVEEVPLPVVTLHLASDSSDVRFVGDMIANDVFNGSDGLWHSFDGWFSRVQLTIVAWCMNADERAALRNALKAVLISNMAVFDAAGLMQVDMQFSDLEDFVTYAAPIYQAVCNFTCYAPSAVEGVDPAIRDVLSVPIV